MAAFTSASKLVSTFTASRNAGDGGVVSTSRMVYKKKFSWLQDNILINLFDNPSTNHYSPSSSVGFDIIRSSILNHESDTLIISGNDTIAISLLPPTFFVPEASALASSEYYRNFSTNVPIPRVDTPFDSFYLNTTAKSHTASDDKYWDWIHYQASDFFHGPVGVAQTGDVFSADVITGYNSPSWSVSNSSFASISSGVLSFSKDTLSTIIVKYSNNNGEHGYLHKQRTLLTAFPDMQLSASRINGNQYMVSATCISAHSEFQTVLDSLASMKSIQFVWGTKIGNGNISWTDTTSTRTFVCTALPGEETRIFMMMLCASGRQSNQNHVVIDRRNLNPFLFNPTETAVSEDFYISNYPVITSGIVLVHQYLAIWHNSDYQGTPIAPDSIQIGSQTFSLSNSYSTTIDGESKTIYCFSFINSTGIQNAISQIQNNFSANYGLTSLVPIQIKNGSTVLQTIQYPLIPSELPPLDPVPLP